MPDQRWFPASEDLRSTACENLLSPLVARIREEVSEWRDGGDQGASNTSKALLTWWFLTRTREEADGSLSRFQYDFAQREAVETVIWLYDVRQAATSRQTGKVVNCYHYGHIMVNTMSTLVVKNLPDQLHEKLRRQARRNHRSVTKEVVHLIEAGVAGQRPKPQLSPPLKLKGGPVTIEKIEAAIADDRYAHYKSLDEVNRYMDELRADRDE